MSAARWGGDSGGDPTPGDFSRVSTAPQAHPITIWNTWPWVSPGLVGHLVGHRARNKCTMDHAAWPQGLGAQSQGTGSLGLLVQVGGAMLGKGSRHPCRYNGLEQRAPEWTQPTSEPCLGSWVQAGWNPTHPVWLKGFWLASLCPSPCEA